MNKSIHNAQIELALADLESLDKPSIRSVALARNVNPETLRRRWNGTQGSIQAANSEYRQRLTDVQEEVLIKNINRLANRGMPPTPAIVKNLAEEMLSGAKVGKNWTASFVRRHGERLTSLYLRNSDRVRTKAEYYPMFELFYSLVSFIYNYIYIYIY